MKLQVLAFIGGRLWKVWDEGGAIHGATDRPRAHEGLSFGEWATASSPWGGARRLVDFIPACPIQRAGSPLPHQLVCAGSTWGSAGGGRSLLRKQAGAPSQRGLLCSPRHQPLSSSRAACQVGQKPRRGSCCYNHILESGAHQCPPGAERRCRLLASPLGPRHRHADTLPAKILSLETPASSCLLPRTSGPDISLLKTGRTAVCMIILGSVLPAGEVASMFDR